MSEFSDQKLRSAMRNSGRQPNQPKPMTTTKRTADPIPARADEIVDRIVEAQTETASGAAPSSNPGISKSSTQATTSRGRLISTNRLPAIESSERLFVLEASSSTS